LIRANVRYDQLDLQALHRVRERFVGQRTGIINQIRAFLLERRIAVRQGLRFQQAEPGILVTRGDALSPRMLRLLEDLAADWRRLDHRGPLQRDRSVGSSRQRLRATDTSRALSASVGAPGPHDKILAFGETRRN